MTKIKPGKSYNIKKNRYLLVCTYCWKMQRKHYYGLEHIMKHRASGYNIKTPACFSLWYQLDCFRYEIYIQWLCECVPLKEKCTSEDIVSTENAFFNKINSLQKLWRCTHQLRIRIERFLGKNTNRAPSMKFFHLLVSYCFKARSAQNTTRYHQRSNCYKNKTSEYNGILTTFL